MTKITCDRCETIITPAQRVLVVFENVKREGDRPFDPVTRLSYDYELCPQCAADFKVWAQFGKPVRRDGVLDHWAGMQPAAAK